MPDRNTIVALGGNVPPQQTRSAILPRTCNQSSVGVECITFAGGLPYSMGEPEGDARSPGELGFAASGSAPSSRAPPRDTVCPPSSLVHTHSAAQALNVAAALQYHLTPAPWKRFQALASGPTWCRLGTLAPCRIYPLKNEPGPESPDGPVLVSIKVSMVCRQLSMIPRLHGAAFGRSAEPMSPFFISHSGPVPVQYTTGLRKHKGLKCTVHSTPTARACGGAGAQRM